MWISGCLTPSNVLFVANHRMEVSTSNSLPGYDVYHSLDLCESCDSKTEETMANLGSIVRNAEKRMADAQLVCASCTGGAPTEPIECVSLDCPWFYARHRADEDISLMPLYQELGSELALDMDAKLSQLELEEC